MWGKLGAIRHRLCPLPIALYKQILDMILREETSP